MSFDKLDNFDNLFVFFVLCTQCGAYLSPSTFKQGQPLSHMELFVSFYGHYLNEEYIYVYIHSTFLNTSAFRGTLPTTY